MADIKDTQAFKTLAARTEAELHGARLDTTFPRALRHEAELVRRMRAMVDI